MKSRIIALTFATTLFAVAPAAAQTAKGAAKIRQAYGARLTPIGPNDVPKDSTRVASRLETRVNSRLSTRIERYNLSEDPTAALRTTAQDGTASLRRQVAPVPQDDGDAGDR